MSELKKCKINQKAESFVPKNLSHDTYFVKFTINKLIEYEFLEGVEIIYFWCDCAYHFRSKELMYFFDKETKEIKNSRMITINFFEEYHGKSQVDSNFGVLTRWFNDGENYTSIKTIDDLIAFFNTKALENQIEEMEYLFAKFTPEERPKIYRKLNINIKAYLSFVFLQQKSLCSHITTTIHNLYTLGPLF